MSPDEMRREFLKGYIGALFFQGKLNAASTAELALKVAEAVREDVAAVSAQIFTSVIGQAATKVRGVAQERLERVAEDLKRRGWKGVWRAIQAQYAAGMDANARSR